MNKAGHISILLLVVLNAALYYSFIQNRRLSALYGDPGIQFPVPAGGLQNGSVAAVKDAQCYVIRVGTDRCQYCRKDYDKYAQLAREAMRVGCGSVSLSPTVSQRPERMVIGSQEAFTFVDLEFGRVLMPFATPQTILLNRARRVLWEADGAMDNHKLEDGLRALRNLQ
jgi:hypothetical protein